MKKMLLVTAVALMSITSSFAQDSRDLSLPGEKWLAKFTGYVCSATSVATAVPADHAAMNVKFERITTDSTLDNGLIKATFVENGKVCRYSAVIFADNAASTMRLVESKSFAVEDGSECAAGKAMIDAGFESNDYLYYGRPHNLAVMTPSVHAEAVCGAGAKFIGVNFVVSGKI